VRLQKRSSVAQLAAAVERVGGSALAIGDTLELVHPSGQVTRHERCELEFFVRAWAIGKEPSRSDSAAVEILG
jgi:hypothetical protein